MQEGSQLTATGMESYGLVREWVPLSAGRRRAIGLGALLVSLSALPQAARAKRPLVDMALVNVPPPAIAPEMQGVLPWRVLAGVTRQRRVVAGTEKGRLIEIDTQVSDEIRRLDKSRVRLNGYMIPLEVKHGQDRFLLSAFPIGCGFCSPDTAHQFAEVELSQALRATDKLLVLEGRFEVLDPREHGGMLYRLRDARAVT